MKMNVQPTPPFNVGPGPQEVGPILLFFYYFCYYYYFTLLKFKTNEEDFCFVDFCIFILHHTQV